MNPIVIETCKQFYQREFNPKETFKLIKSSGITFWSWGCTQVIALGANALLMKVNGNHHKGFVLITLGFLDLYEVRLINTSGEVVGEITDLYFDVLVDAIDEKIEKIPAYNR